MWVDEFAFDGPVGEMPLDPEFVATPMMEQLGKVKDGGAIIPGLDLPEKKYKPHNTVVTDDGETFVVNATQAKNIIDAVRNVDVRDRLDVLKQIQTSKGFKIILKYVA